MFSPLSIMAWAWAAWASGKVAWTIGLMAPCSSNGQARSRSARAMAPLKATGADAAWNR